MNFMKWLITPTKPLDRVLHYTFICDEAKYEIYLREKEHLSNDDKQKLLTRRIKKLTDTKSKIPSHFKEHHIMYDALIDFYKTEIMKMKKKIYEKFKNYSTFHKKRMIHDIHKKLQRLNKDKLRKILNSY